MWIQGLKTLRRGYYSLCKCWTKKQNLDAVIVQQNKFKLEYATYLEEFFVRTQRELDWVWIINLVCTMYSFLFSLFTLVQVNLFQKLFFLQNMGRTFCVQKLFCMSETISIHNMLSPGLSLEFSYIELVIQWIICRHNVG